MAHTRTTILHLSDVHFGSQHAFPIDSTDVYDRAVGSLIDHLTSDLDKIDCHPDLLLISGDLTSRASTREFEQAKEFIERLLDRDRLDKDRLVIVPGNHDAIWKSGDSEATLSEFKSFASNLYQTPVRESEIRFATHGDVFLMGLDATRLETPSAGGIGFIGRDQLRFAEELTDRESTSASIRILALHHHLLPVTWIGDRPENFPEVVTLDAPTILAWAQENHFSLVLHGHQHQAFLCTFHFPNRRHGPLVLSGAPSMGGKADSLPPNARNGYQIVVVEGPELKVETRSINEACEFETNVETAFIHDLGRVFAKSAVPSTLASSELPLDEARQQCLFAISRLRTLLSVSYGPRGGLRSVRARVDHVRDGQLIVESIDFQTSPIEQHVGQAIRSLTQNVAMQLGDGRKTSALMCLDMAEYGLRAVLDGENDLTVATAILDGAEAASNLIRNEFARRVTGKGDLARAAETAMCGHQEIASMVADALEKVGSDGLVVIDEGMPDATDQISSKIETRAKFQVKTPDWLTDVRSLVTSLSDCLVLVVPAKIGHTSLVPVLEHAKKCDRPLLLACEELDATAQEMLAVNIANHNVIALPAFLRAYGEWRVEEFRDLAVITGATLFDASNTFMPAKVADSAFGTAEEVCLDDENLLIKGEPGDEAELRRVRWMLSLREQIEQSPSPYATEKLEQRIARIGGAVATLTVGGTSDTDRRIRRNLVTDGLHAARRAIEGGVVQGGGTCHFRCALALRARENDSDSRAAGFRAVRSALEKPLGLLVEEVGEDIEAVTDSLSKRGGTVFDAMQGAIVDQEMGPIDPAPIAAEVVLFAAESAARIVRTRSWDTSLVFRDSPTETDVDE